MKKFKEFFLNESKYLAQIEFEAYDVNGNEVIDDELYGEVEIDAIDKTDAYDKIDRLGYIKTSKHPNGKIISYVEIIKNK